MVYSPVTIAARDSHSGERPVCRPDSEPVFVHRLVRIDLPVAGAGRRKGTRARRKPHRLQTPQLHGGDVPGHGREWTRCALSSFTRMAAVFMPRRCAHRLISLPFLRRLLRPPNLSGCRKPGRCLVVEAAGTRLELSKQTGQILSWRAGDQELVIGGPILNLGEGTLGAAARRPWRRGRGGPISNRQPPILTNAVVTATMDGAAAKISVTTDVYLAGSDELKGQLHYTLAIGADAQADVAWNLVWKGTNTTALEAGLKFLLPAATDRMSWLSENLWTEYPPDHIGNPSGSVDEQGYFLPFHQAQRALDDAFRQREILSGRAAHRSAVARAAVAWMPMARCCS